MAALLARLRAALAARLALHDNWRELVLNAWSVRFALLAALCEGVVLFCGFFTDAPEGVRPWFAFAGFVATVLGGVARLMPQKNINAGGA